MNRLENIELQRLFVKIRVVEALSILMFVSLIMPVFSFYYLPSKLTTGNSIVEIILMSPFIFTSYSINFLLSPTNVIYTLLSYAVFRYANHYSFLNIKTIGYLNISIFVFFHVTWTGILNLEGIMRFVNSGSMLNWATFMVGVVINYYFAVIIFKKIVRLR